MAPVSEITQSTDVATGETTNEAVILPYTPDKEYFIDSVGEVPKKPFYMFFKRLFDASVCGVALLILSPILLAIVITIKIVSPGPVLYIQERLGLNGKIIRVPKFRSMRTDAEQAGAQWSEGDEDERIYPFGRILRKSRLDELPQLWCCVIGTMSLVGPRPERKCFADAFETYIHGFSERLKVPPGITGWAQVNGGYDLKPEEKIVYDVEYIKKRSFWFDLKIMFRTVSIIFTHEGAK